MRSDMHYSNYYDPYDDDTYLHCKRQTLRHNYTDTDDDHNDHHNNHNYAYYNNYYHSRCNLHDHNPYDATRVGEAPTPGQCY